MKGKEIGGVGRGICCLLFVFSGLFGWNGFWGVVLIELGKLVMFGKVLWGGFG